MVKIWMVEILKLTIQVVAQDPDHLVVLNNNQVNQQQSSLVTLDLRQHKIQLKTCFLNAEQLKMLELL